MKRFLTLVTITFLALAGHQAFTASRSDLWKQADQAIQKGLPQSAITNLDQIIPKALQEKAYGEAAKAIARKIVLEGNIQGNKPEEKITRMQAQIAKAPKEILPLLQTIQADWYWHYFQQNRWRFMQRTATGEQPGQDFTTWDLPRLYAEINRTFSQALSGSNQLQQIPISTFNDLLEKGTLPDNYRPTLYDFIAQEALKFYTSGEQAAAKPDDAFEVSADSPILGSVENFLVWQPETTQTNSPLLKAISLYQSLLRFHAKDPDPTAFIDANLARLLFAHNVAFGENNSPRYNAALRSLAEKWATNEVSAMAWYYLGQNLSEAEEWTEAFAVAQRGENAHPKSPGGQLCHNLIEHIKAKSASIVTERVWNRPWPKIAVTYRNVTQVYFRAVLWDWNDFLSKKHSRPEHLNDKERSELLAKKPALEWSAELPPTSDFKQRTETLPAPAKLKPGHYFIIASHRPDFAESDNQVSYAAVWVSDLALVVFTREAKVEGFVVDAISGDPIAHAEVVAWHLDQQGERQMAGTPQFTDANGVFSFKSEGYRGLLLRARAKGQELASEHEYYGGEFGRPTPDNRVIFFTDRALYRPGQTIHFKGLCLHVDTERNDYRLLAGRQVEFALVDSNGKEVSKQSAVTSDYGSFSGNFTAPRDRVMGAYSIQMRSGGDGATGFNIEEYKRPKFHVTLDAPALAPKLNDKVLLQGKAEAYTGAAVDGANVKWRVVREVRWPEWWFWRCWNPSRRSGSDSQEIAHGSVVTDHSGTFTIDFMAHPDPKVDEKSEAIFRFRVYADVTDTAGETRSADRAVNVGFVALTARIDLDQWQSTDKPVELNIKTTTVNDDPQPTEGSLKIYRLKEPSSVQRASLPEYRPFMANGNGTNQDLSNPASWPLGPLVFQTNWTSNAEGNYTLQQKLGVGVFRAELESRDRFGKKVTALTQITVLQPSADKFTIKIPNLVSSPKWKVEPGQEFIALWGTGYPTGRAFIEVEHHGKFLQRYWTKPGVTQHQIQQSISENLRGGFTVHVTQVRENRAYFSSSQIEVPWSNKDLDVKWEHFTSKLQPNQKETWTAVVTGPKAQKAVAEMVATLYDESLDAFLQHNWLSKLNIFYTDRSYRSANFCNTPRHFAGIHHGWRTDYKDVVIRYREFPPDLVANYRGYAFGYYAREARGVLYSSNGAEMPVPACAPVALGTVMEALPAKQKAIALRRVAGDYALADKAEAAGPAPQAPPQAPSVDLSKISARKNLNETAFFFPQLTSDSNGVVRMTFTMPEALTTWKFIGFAHDKQLRSGFLQGETVTAKDLMVQPNPPRFLREGDTLEFTVKVSNQTAARQSGRVRLSFSEALTTQNADQPLSNTTPELSFDIPAKESRSLSWRITIPDGCGFLIYNAVASTGKVSDGEEGYLPVLSRRILVTESLPLPIRGPASKSFQFTNLLQSGQSKTLQNKSLTVQMVSNPSWYAVMALPYLMEFPYECTEQTFNRLYANTLARHIANSDPKIRRIFDQWKGTPALDSPLEKNQDLKSVLLEETPWVRQAEKESQSRKNVGLLFDQNRLDAEAERTLRKLAEEQLGDGSWPWFPGGRGNNFITLYITTGFGRLRHLGVDIDVNCAIKSLHGLDGWMDDNYHEILKSDRKEDYVPTSIDALYLYGRSFFLKDKPIADNHRAMLNFYLGQARKHWLKTDCRQTQGHLAVALHRFSSASQPDNASAARDIMKSIKERSVTNEELGMFWRDLELSWWWFRAPIESQALMIEAFDEIMGDTAAVEECRVWLLKQKQTQDWKTTKATADAIYALLLRGKDILASDKLVEVSLGGLPIKPEAPREGLAPAVEAGTGFYEKKFVGSEIKPQFGNIAVKKVDQGVAWGSVHWQYLEDMSKVTPYQGTPLKLKKTLFTKVNTGRGPVLEPLKAPLAVGDELVVRIELRVDRDMEYIHLKDQRGSGTEPVNVLSQYKYQDGLAYYESTRDTASHFFIDYLPKGTYVFEYSTRVQHRGQYQTGVASIQCMYAPEFNSHSESLALVVK